MPEVSVVPGNLSELVQAVFTAGGPLAAALPDFEARAGQTEMAAAVAHAFEAGGVLLAEAGTGTGKTIAYLVPAILSRQRVLISTGTKNLQEQIYFKDIPALRDALGVSFTATCMKGRANYLCLHRLDQLGDDPGPARSFGNDVFLPIIREWSHKTDTGDRAELEGLPEDLPFWNDVSATADTCLGAECPRYDDCFVTRMRQRAAASDIVIVNHHLLCADAAVRQNAFGEVIPACHTAILDEAHQLEDVATQHFGYSVSTYRVEELAHDVERLVDRHDVQRGVERLRDHARVFFAELTLAHRANSGDPSRSSKSEGWGPTRPRNEQRVRATVTSLAPAGEAGAQLTGALDGLEATLALAGTSHAATDEEDADASSEIAALARRVAELRDELRVLLRAGDGDYVYFVEFRGRGVFLRAARIDVSAIVRELLVDRMRTLVLTSATLTVDGGFEYVRRRLGITRAEEICVPSEFDFRSQALLYLPSRMPDPRSADFAMAAGREVVEILKRTRGRAFVLFTSYATLGAVLAIAEMALEYPILAQGTAPRTELLKRFRETPHAILFGTSSFWQGVDVVGEALSCVIVDKLPFASPADPVTAARIDAIRDQGGDPFGDYQLPLAILALQQGLGRLIRHRRDRGVWAVLDPRLQTKGYGRRFIASLPPAPVVRDLSFIEAFFTYSPPGPDTVRGAQK